MTFWIWVERIVAHFVWAALAALAVALVCGVVGGSWSLWWLALAAPAAWLAFQVLDALIMTQPAKRWELNTTCYGVITDGETPNRV